MALAMRVARDSSQASSSAAAADDPGLIPHGRERGQQKRRPVGGMVSPTDTVSAYRGGNEGDEESGRSTAFTDAKDKQKGGAKGREGLLLNALSADPRNVDALTRLGLLYEQRGRYAKCIECLHRATMVEPRKTQVPGPTTWTITRYDGPNHLGLWYNALPEHQMALITSDCALFSTSSSTSRTRTCA